ncbi:hypothetical protein AAG570_010813 [Ranatra chinensis]|uniref:Uncharacterized protein n=1 Tax=Ranatra chinensis TaxID=642074 RepID=A0ABD0YIT3_9HEMI
MEQATTTAMAQLAVNIIKLIPIFDSNPGDLEEWLTAAAQAGAHLEAIDQSSIGHPDLGLWGPFLEAVTRSSSGLRHRDYQEPHLRYKEAKRKIRGLPASCQAVSGKTTENEAGRQNLRVTSLTELIRPSVC